MAREWEEHERYGRSGRERGRGRAWRGERERDWSERAGDEMRSWAGDEDADRRRMEDEHRAGMYRDPDYDYPGYGGYADRGIPMGAAPGYDRPYGPYGAYGNEGRWEGRGRDDRYGAGFQERPRGRGKAGGAGHYPGRWERQDEREPYWTGSDHGARTRGDRGFLERAGDEVRSWFGDEDAEQRREADARYRGRGPKNYVRSDERIREDVNDRLYDDPHIDASDIEVSVNGGEVTLDGTVAERFAKRHAEDLAERVSGVKHVQNNLRVSTAQQTAAGQTGTGGSGLTERADRSGSAGIGAGRH